MKESRPLAVFPKSWDILSDGHIVANWSKENYYLSVVAKESVYNEKVITPKTLGCGSAQRFAHRLRGFFSMTEGETLSRSHDTMCVMWQGPLILDWACPRPRTGSRVGPLLAGESHLKKPLRRCAGRCVDLQPGVFKRWLPFHHEDTRLHKSIFIQSVYTFTNFKLKHSTGKSLFFQTVSVISMEYIKWLFSLYLYPLKKYDKRMSLSTFWKHMFCLLSNE